MTGNGRVRGACCMHADGRPDSHEIDVRVHVQQCFAASCSGWAVESGSQQLRFCGVSRRLRVDEDHGGGRGSTSRVMSRNSAVIAQMNKER